MIISASVRKKPISASLSMGSTIHLQFLHGDALFIQYNGKYIENDSTNTDYGRWDSICHNL